MTGRAGRVPRLGEVEHPHPVRADAVGDDECVVAVHLDVASSTHWALSKPNITLSKLDITFAVGRSPFGGCAAGLVVRDDPSLDNSPRYRHSELTGPTSEAPPPGRPSADWPMNSAWSCEPV